jgi:hypothetical protein
MSDPVSEPDLWRRPDGATFRVIHIQELILVWYLGHWRRGVLRGYGRKPDTWKQIAYFATSFLSLCLGAGLLGSNLQAGQAIAIVRLMRSVRWWHLLSPSVLTFINSQDLSSLFGLLSRFRGGGSNGNK